MVLCASSCGKVGFVNEILIILCLGLAAWFFGKKLLKPKGKYGTQSEDEFDRKILLADEYRAGLIRDTGLLVGFAGPPEREKALRMETDQHGLLVGPIGSGKNTTVESVMLFDYEGSALVIDPKGQLAAITGRHRAERFGQDIYLLNPFKVLDLPTHTYNPLRFIDPESLTFESDCRRIAEGLIEPKEENHWETAALDLVSMLVMWTVLHEEEKNLVTVRSLLTLPKDLRREKFDEIANKVEDSHPGLSVGARRYGFDSKESKEVEDCIQTANVQLTFLGDRAIENILKGGPDEISFVELKRQPSTIYLIIPPELLKTHGKFLRLLVMSALGEFYRDRRKPEKRVLFLLDEFPALGYLPSMENAASVVREYGIQLFFVMQNISQLKNLYKGMSASFVSSAGWQQYFTPNDTETATHIEKRSGIRIVKKENESQTTTQGNIFTGAPANSSITIGTHEIEEPIYKAGELYGLPKDCQILIPAGYHRALWVHRRPYWEVAKRFGWLVSPDPYHMTKEQEAAFKAWLNSGETCFHGKRKPSAVATA
jgi:type IV secretion system protein VirD4